MLSMQLIFNLKRKVSCGRRMMQNIKKKLFCILFRTLSIINVSFTSFEDAHISVVSKNPVYGSIFYVPNTFSEQKLKLLQRCIAFLHLETWSLS